MKTASLKTPADEKDSALIVPIGFAAAENPTLEVEFDEEEENLKLRQQLKLKFDVNEHLCEEFKPVYKTKVEPELNQMISNGIRKIKERLSHQQSLTTNQTISDDASSTEPSQKSPALSKVVLKSPNHSLSRA